MSEPSRIPVRKRSITPAFTSRTRTPSPPVTSAASIRRRSPSPVKTGKVDRVRTRFESTGAVERKNACPGHQTLPKTFKLGQQSRVSVGDGPVCPRDRTTETTRTRSKSRGDSPNRHSFSHTPNLSQCPRMMPRVLNGHVDEPKQNGFSSPQTSPQPPPRNISNRLNRSQGNQQQRFQQMPSGGENKQQNVSADPNSSAFSVRSISDKILRSEMIEDVKNAANFLSQRLPSISGNAHHPAIPMKSPAMVYNFMKAPFKVSEG